MGEKFTSAAVTIALGIVGVAVVAVLVSGSSNTSGFFQAIGSGFGRMLCTALSPIGVKCPQIESVTSNITFGPITG
jgi:hypothetical protein